MRVCTYCGYRWTSTDHSCPECYEVWYYDRSNYTPTQQDIRRECAAIRSTWSPEEENRRRAVAYQSNAVFFDNMVILRKNRSKHLES